MDKEQQIEEMARVILEASCYGNECEACSIIKTVEEQRCCVCVKALYNAGYRKIDDNCAVITKDDLKLYQRQAVKEFADKLKAKTLDETYKNKDVYIHIIDIYKMIEETLMEYEE